MTKTPIVFAALTALTLSGAALATELTPMQAGTFVVGDHVASVYYTPRGEHYDVVTTIAPEYGLDGQPMRFLASLDAGESQTISIGGFGDQATTRGLQLAHGGDRLIVTTIGTQLTSR